MIRIALGYLLPAGLVLLLVRGLREAFDESLKAAVDPVKPESRPSVTDGRLERT